MLSLLTQLNSANSPVTRSKEQSAKRKEAWQRTTEKARREHTASAIERYRRVMVTKSWLTQTQIEFSLGYSSTTSTAFIKKLVGLRLVERRNRNGAVKYVRKLGYEYHWAGG